MKPDLQASESGGAIPPSPERIRVGLAVLVALVLGILLVVDLVGGSPEPSGNQTAGRVVLSESELVARAGSIDPRPYWVGPRPGIERFELARTPSNTLFITYLEDGQGEDGPEALRVATYPVPDARDALERASRTGAVALSREEGLVALAPPDETSAFVVFDDQPDLQIEVFSPVAGEAARLVATGKLIPLGWGPIE